MLKTNNHSKEKHNILLETLSLVDNIKIRENV